MDQNKTMTVKTLRTAKIEGVGEYMTYKEGDVRSYFDVVVSGVFMHTVGKEYGKRTVEAAAERTRGRCRNNFFYFSIVDLKKNYFLYLFLSINFFRIFCLTWNFLFLLKCICGFFLIFNYLIIYYYFNYMYANNVKCLSEKITWTKLSATKI